MRNKSGINVECIFTETIDFINISYINLNKTIRYEQRPHGEWRITFVGCECSVCKDTTLAIPMNFCPNCGADMRKEGEQKCGE